MVELASKAIAEEARGWVKDGWVQVLALGYFSGLHSLLSQAMQSGVARAWRHLGTEHWARTLCLISLFVGSWRCGSDVLEAPVTAFRFQWVKPAILRSMASQGRRVSRKAPCLIRAREGQILFASSAALQQRAALCQGRRVWVLKVKRYVDAGAVAASIDTHAWFAMGGGAGTSVAWHAAVTWHAARLHHRCRLFVLPTAPCEAIGSFMRLHWDPRGSEITPQAFSDRIFYPKRVFGASGQLRTKLWWRQLQQNGSRAASAYCGHFPSVALLRALSPETFLMIRALGSSPKQGRLRCKV